MIHYDFSAGYFLDFNKKINDFLFENYDYLSERVPFDDDKVFVAGGFLPRRWIGSPLRDIDLYVNKDDDNYLQNVIEDYRCLDWTVRETLEKSYDPDGEKRQKHWIVSKDGEPNIDLIAFHQPKSIDHIDCFDLNIVQYAFTENYFHCPHSDLFDHLQNKEMYFTGNICMKTFERIVKYTKMGYSMDENLLANVRNSFVAKIKEIEQKKREEAAKTIDEEVPF